MYLLYAPFLLGMIIAALLAISTSNIQNFFERLLKSKFLAALSSSFLLALLFFAPLGYFLVTLTLKLNTIEPEIFRNIEITVRNFLLSPPEYLHFLKPYMNDITQEVSVNSIASYVLSLTGSIGSLSAGYLKTHF